MEVSFLLEDLFKALHVLSFNLASLIIIYMHVIVNTAREIKHKIIKARIKEPMSSS